MIEAPVKLNLFLHILGRNKRDYHTLESLVIFPNIYDEIHLTPAPETSLNIEGKFAFRVDVNNITLCAMRDFQNKFNIKDNFHIKLKKNIPIGAGLGGGSADGAAILRFLAKRYNKNIDDILDIGKNIGADIPACIYSKTLIMKGIGEKILFLPALPKFYILLVKPNFNIATVKIFDMLREKKVFIAKEIPLYNTMILKDFIEFLKNCRNDLEIPAIKLYPKIKNILQELADLDNCLLSRMSGSGSTCFGIFSTQELAKNAAKFIRNNHPDWWVAIT